MDGGAVEVAWGKNINQDVFSRWVQGMMSWCALFRYRQHFHLQGFRFSEDEPLALVQQSGGPCAILSPVQVCLKLNPTINCVIINVVFILRHS